MTDHRPSDGFPPGSPEEGGGPPGARHASGDAAPVSTALPWSYRVGAHRAPERGPLRRRLLWTVAAAAVAALLAVVLLRPWAADEPSPAEARERAAAADVVRWADAELPADTPVTVPDEVLADVLAAGADEERFRSPGTKAPDALLLVTGEPPEGAVVLTRFPADDGTALTLVDPTPGRPTPDELDRRRRLAAAILANPHTGATGRAADVLERGHVDARLLGLLAVLVTQLHVGIADLPTAAGEPADGPLARQVLVDRLGEDPVGPDEPATERLLTFLDAQLPPFAADSVEVTEEGALIGFRYESAPDALVTERTP